MSNRPKLCRGDKGRSGIESAELRFCRVLSPIDGRVSNKIVTVGIWLTAARAGDALDHGAIGSCLLLCRCRRTLGVEYEKLAEERALLSARDGKIPCFIQLGDETGYSHKV